MVRLLEAVGVNRHFQVFCHCFFHTSPRKLFRRGRRKESGTSVTVYWTMASILTQRSWCTLIFRSTGSQISSRRRQAQLSLKWLQQLLPVASWPQGVRLSVGLEHFMAELRGNPISRTRRTLLMGRLFSVSSSMCPSTHPEQESRFEGAVSECDNAAESRCLKLCRCVIESSYCVLKRSGQTMNLSLCCSSVPKNMQQLYGYF